MKKKYTNMKHLHEDIEITKQNSFWLRGDNTGNTESLKTDSEISIPHPLYLTGDLKYAYDYAFEHTRELERKKKTVGNPIVKVYELRLSSRKDIHTKICDLTDEQDLHSLGYPLELAMMFKQIEVYYSFSRASFFMNKREHIPTEFILATNFIYFTNSIVVLGYDPKNSIEKSITSKYSQLKKHIALNKVLAGEQYEFPTSFSRKDLIAMCTSYDGVYDKPAFRGSIDIDSVIGYLKVLKMIHDNYPSKYVSVDIQNKIDYVDFLSRCLFNDIYERGYCGYFCPEKNKDEYQSSWIVPSQKLTHFPCIALFDSTLVQRQLVFDAYEFKKAVDIVYKSMDPKNVEKYSQIRKNTKQNDGIRSVVELLLKWEKDKHRQDLRNQRIARRAERRRQREYANMSSTRYVWFKDGELDTNLADKVIQIKNTCRKSSEKVAFSYQFAHKILIACKNRPEEDFQNILDALSGKYNMYIGFTTYDISHECVYNSFVLDNNKDRALRHYIENVPHEYQIQRYTSRILDNYRGQKPFRVFLNNINSKLRLIGIS